LAYKEPINAKRILPYHALYIRILPVIACRNKPIIAQRQTLLSQLFSTTKDLFLTQKTMIEINGIKKRPPPRKP
jgi:hypothetical protein